MTLKENRAYLNNFGWSLTWWKTVNKLITGISDGKLAWKVHLQNYHVIEKYIAASCSDTITRLEQGVLNRQNKVRKLFENKEIKKNSIIWTMWWQGEKMAPPLVRACIGSMRKHGNGHEVIVIDSENIDRYVNIPRHIVKLFESSKQDGTALKNITLQNTHFSDIVRFYLLYVYGGIWMDASVFLTDSLPEHYFEQEWLTLTEEDKWYVGEGQWTVFFMGAQHKSLLMLFLYEMLIEYWSKNKYYVTYLMIYNMMNIAQNTDLQLKAVMDHSHFGNERVITMNRNYNREVNEKEIREFLEKQHIHKLSWKWWGCDKDSPMYLETEEGKLTWFGFLYQNYVGV